MRGMKCTTIQYDNVTIIFIYFVLIENVNLDARHSQYLEMAESLIGIAKWDSVWFMLYKHFLLAFMHGILSRPCCDVPACLSMYKCLCVFVHMCVGVWGRGKERSEQEILASTQLAWLTQCHMRCPGRGQSPRFRDVFIIAQYSAFIYDKAFDSPMLIKPIPMCLCPVTKHHTITRRCEEPCCLVLFKTSYALYDLCGAGLLGHKTLVYIL